MSSVDEARKASAGIAGWPAATRRLLLAALLLGAIGLVAAALFDLSGATIDGIADKAVSSGDADTYARIVQLVHKGIHYYDAAHGVLISDGYGTRSVFNWRTPVWPILLSTLPGLWVAQLGLGLIALLSVVLAYRMLWRDRPVIEAAISAIALALGLAGLAAPESVLFTEVAAGTLIVFSICLYGNGWRGAGLMIALAALFVRELAAPYVLVCLVLALHDRRKLEIAGWVLGLAAYAVYFGWHWTMVQAQLGPIDRDYVDGWVQFGGFAFLARTMGFDGLFGLLPPFLVAVLLPVGLLGLVGWRQGARAAATVTAYVALFAVIGKPFNGYWGALFAPVAMLGLGISAEGARLLWVERVRRP